MTDQVQTADVQTQPATSDSGYSAPAAAPAPQEKHVPQSEVNKIVGKIRDESYQKGMSDAMSRNQHQNAAPAYEPPPQPAMQQSYQPTQQVGGMNQLSDEQLRQKIVEENQKLEQFKSYQGLVNSFVSKVEAGKSKYENFDAVVKDLNLPQIPVIWQTAEKFDNPADIMWHLRHNPGKLSQLLAVAYSPELVKTGMQEISDSLRQNEAAADEKSPNAPLSRPKPSNIGMGNGKGGLSVADYKKIYRA